MELNGTKKRKITFNEAIQLVNDTLSQRSLYLQRLVGKEKEEKDIPAECGYPETIGDLDYLRMFKRFGVARRVVSIYPTECWSVNPLVYETEDDQFTPFEAKWKELSETVMDVEEDRDPLYYLKKGDIRSRILRYGAILIGFSDGDDLSRPVPGILDDGTAGKAVSGMELLYMRVFDQTQIKIKTREVRNNRRYGKPVMYTIKLEEPDTIDPESGNSTVLKDQDVHWTRIIHLADAGDSSSELFADPVMECVWDQLLDTRKILGPAAEMFYKGGFPGLSIEIDPKALELGMEIDSDSIDDEMFKYMNGIQRYLKLVGMRANSLAPQIADPTNHLMSQLNTIAMSIGAPLRIFMGSEQAQLASGQDVRTWNRRLTQRNNRYLTPKVLRPFIMRLVMAGVLPKPKKPVQIWWPDVNIPSEEERTQNADRMAAALMKYVMSKSYQTIQPSDFFKYILKMEPMEIEAIMAKLKQKAEVDFIETPTAGGPADSGGGTAPSASAKSPK